MMSFWKREYFSLFMQGLSPPLTNVDPRLLDQSPFFTLLNVPMETGSNIMIDR